MNRNKFPIFGELQYRSAIAVHRMLLEDAFEDPEPVVAQFTGLVNRVNLGLEGNGTAGWRRMMYMGRYMPHETMVLGGPLVHIPQDIRGGLQDSLRDVGRLPTRTDYRQMYGAVRASMRSVSSDLIREVGANTTTSAIQTNESAIRITGRDPIQMIRDREYSLSGGTPDYGLPAESNIQMALDAIREDPDARQPIIRSFAPSTRSGGSAP